MAVDTAPKLTRKRNLAFAIETTTGTAASLSASDGVTNVFTPSMPFSTEEIERDSQGASYSPIITAKGARSATASFETEIVGSGASGVPIWTRLLRGCAMSPSGGVFSPVTDATETLTIGSYTSGLLKTMVGAMGTFTMTLRRGQKGRIAWNFTGVQAPPTDTANIAPTYITTKAPRVGATTLTIGGNTYRIPEVVIEYGADVQLREDLTAVDSASEPTGYRAAMIVNRRTIVRVSPEAAALATVNWHDIYRDSTTVALACEWGADANNSFEIAAPAMQLIADPTDEDRNGLLAHGLQFLCTRSAAAGNDDFVFTLA